MSTLPPPGIPAHERPGDVRVVVVETEPLAAGLAATLGREGLVVEGVAATVPALRHLCAFSLPGWVNPSVAVVADHVDGVAGGRLVALLRRRWPAVKVVLVSDDDSAAAVATAMRWSCSGLVHRRRSVRDLAAAIVEVDRGGSAFDARVLQEVFAARRPDPRPSVRRAGVPELTARERAVLELLAGGLSTLAIATSLDIATPTVRAHVRSLMVKLHAHSRTEAVVAAARFGLVLLA